MPQHPIELILARQLAGGLAVPVLLVDENGDTVFFNEPAERIFSRRFDDIDALTFEERAAVMAPRREDGSPMPVEEMPAVAAMRERRPVHAVFHLHGFDGRLRPVEATGIPLVSGGGHLLGAMVVLWTRPDAAEPALHS